jgi:hypothetical protein
MAKFTFGKLALQDKLWALLIIHIRVRDVVLYENARALRGFEEGEERSRRRSRPPNPLAASADGKNPKVFLRK